MSRERERRNGEERPDDRHARSRRECHDEDEAEDVFLFSRDLCLSVEGIAHKRCYTTVVFVELYRRVLSFTLTSGRVLVNGSSAENRSTVYPTNGANGCAVKSREREREDRNLFSVTSSFFSTLSLSSFLLI